jgi:hypothetical protein
MGKLQSNTSPNSYNAGTTGSFQQQSSAKCRFPLSQRVIFGTFMGGWCIALSNGNAFPGLVTPSVTGTVVRAFPERAICCSSRIPKTNPGEGGATPGFRNRRSRMGDRIRTP